MTTRLRRCAALEGDPRVLFLRYEELDASALPMLEYFTGVHGLRAEVLDAKINTWSGSRDGHSPDQYVAPRELSAEEYLTIERAAGEALPEYRSLGALVS